MGPPGQRLCVRSRWFPDGQTPRAPHPAARLARSSEVSSGRGSAGCTVGGGPGRLSGAALPLRSGSRPAVELRRVGCDALLATERSCESLSGGAMRGALRGRPYWAGPRLGVARGLRL
ncbi:hypothetical protein EMIHUDRAFT_439311 [Emiliania huxleyi CCMP1516]|uniref:Uncharacterized protein n=2 Tax=Emiliania huxleyi TaxID=2903 RepID=A0A0D3HYP7_EMIH1|nr:hypothetical protein EMIHUDRAFT_439311 [Emiliania huxleyi CCMP1516]EOD04132.1 hypothetical protein EMIHUDRAFT_439311 [Emiliania huxleyi CCMP1516]|eukprot:XP_005756561.1 hypothetical protein EMIHUDRAFT_439311 [Emiliania huxleyi CCMP1516]